MQQNNSSEPVEVLGLDIGDARIGVARANTMARIPQSLGVVPTPDAIERIQGLVSQTQAQLLVVGLPIGQHGQLSAQAQSIVKVVQALKVATGLPCVMVDESYSSKEADAYLQQNGNKTASHNDDIAACIVLDRYFKEGGRVG